MKFSFLFSKNYKHSTDIGLLILRIFVAVLLLYGHGYKKLGIIFSGGEISFPDPIGLGSTFSFYLVAFAEGICAIFLILGLLTRFSAITLIINFLVILSMKIELINENFAFVEMIMLYLLIFIVLAFTGSGKLSLDYFLTGKKR